MPLIYIYISFDGDLELERFIEVSRRWWMPWIFGPSTMTARHGKLLKRRSAMWKSPWNVPPALRHEERCQNGSENAFRDSFRGLIQLVIAPWCASKAPSRASLRCGMAAASQRWTAWWRSSGLRADGIRSGCITGTLSHHCCVPCIRNARTHGSRRSIALERSCCEVRPTHETGHALRLSPEALSWVSKTIRPLSLSRRSRKIRWWSASTAWTSPSVLPASNKSTLSSSRRYCRSYLCGMRLKGSCRGSS